MSWELWGLFVVTEGLLCITPGPAVLLVVAQGLTRGIPASVSATFGVLTGNTITFCTVCDQPWCADRSILRGILLYQMARRGVPRLARHLGVSRTVIHSVGEPRQASRVTSCVRQWHHSTAGKSESAALLHCIASTIHRFERRYYLADIYSWGNERAARVL